MVSECALDAATEWIQHSYSTSCPLSKLHVYLHCHLLVTGVSCDLPLYYVLEYNNNKL